MGADLIELSPRRACGPVRLGNLPPTVWPASYRTRPEDMTGAPTRGHPHIHMSDLTQDLLDGQELAPTAPVRPEAPTFAELGARAETVEALAAAGITRAFAIQEYAIPIALRGADLIGQAPTGTGKTLGFGVPLLERVFAPAEGSRRRAPGAGRRPHPRAGPPGRQGHRRRRPDPRRPGAADLRRRGVRAAGRRAAARASRSWSARPAACSTWPSRSSLELDRVQRARPRRGRPDARPGLPRRRREDPGDAAGATGRRCSSRPPCRTRSSRCPGGSCASR